MLVLEVALPRYKVIQNR